MKSESEKENANPELIKSLQKHKQRLENKAYMYYWCAVMSFSPLNIFLSRKHPTAQCPVINVDVANDVFQSEEPLFYISEDEWNSYINCKNFDWQPSVHTSVWKWWEDVGKENFPSIYQAARHYLWVPPIATACDSLLSIMGWKYNPRQASLDSDVIATQMFLRGNLNKLTYLCKAPADTQTTEDGYKSEGEDETEPSESEHDI